MGYTINANIMCIYRIYYKNIVRYIPTNTTLKTKKTHKQTLNLNPNTPHTIAITMCTLRYEIKLWMVNPKGEAVFGNGLAELLEEIDRYHSILEAAKHLTMSYRYALHRLTLAEERLGEPLVKRLRGGAKGGGSSEVTTFGKDLVLRYRIAQVKLDGVLRELP
jgi:molybdate transport system regulatory protein